MLISFLWRWARENVISKMVIRCKYLIIKRDFRVFLSHNLVVKCFTAKIFIKEKTFPFRAGESLCSSFSTLPSPAAKVFMKNFPQTHFLEERSHQLLSLVIMEHEAKVKGFRRCLYMKRRIAKRFDEAPSRRRRAWLVRLVAECECWINSRLEVKAYAGA